MNMIDFCCKKMKQIIKEIRDKNLIDHSIVYNKRYREFFVHFNEEAEQRDREMLMDIFWCPWCGTKLPKGLSNEWWDILEQEYNIKDPSDSESDKVPAEFWTDEWWKKRGL
ncbi:MAG: hypothetical protein LN563_04205 [Rickettsia endosymbiont of Platyusa sonomae]|nr:hypothetical protein [Rickettsia endosymbiont of Platyusa sonomae]